MLQWAWTEFAAYSAVAAEVSFSNRIGHPGLHWNSWEVKHADDWAIGTVSQLIGVGLSVGTGIFNPPSLTLVLLMCS